MEKETQKKLALHHPLRSKLEDGEQGSMGESITALQTSN